LGEFLHNILNAFIDSLLARLLSRPGPDVPLIIPESISQLV
jgi:hypothetical protein